MRVSSVFPNDAIQKQLNKSDNKTLKFKTNIKGNGVAQVTPLLNGTKGVSHWEVLPNKDKILSVHSESVTQEEVIKKVTEVGFKIEFLSI